jgi:deazaflavin-dependent oxidoreductase (nitroreductase family)
MTSIAVGERAGESEYIRRGTPEEEQHIVSDWNTQIIDEFRTNDGKVGGMFEGAPLLLLHHAGARTGTERVTPLMYQAIPNGYAVFASKAGADTNPDWLHNVVANPATTVEVGTNSVGVSARIAEGPEHDDIWSRQKTEWPQFAEYEQKTTRDVIPVVVLERG